MKTIPAIIILEYILHLTPIADDEENNPFHENIEQWREFYTIISRFIGARKGVKYYELKAFLDNEYYIVGRSGLYGGGYVDAGYLVLKRMRRLGFDK